MQGDVEELGQPHSAIEAKKAQNKVEIGKAGVEIAKKTLRKEFGDLVERKEVLDEVSGLIRVLSHDVFVKGMPVWREGDERVRGYRTIGGELVLDADAMESEDHAFQVVYHEFLEELSARLGVKLRTFLNFHEGIVQYFVRLATEQQGRKYYISAYERTSDIVARLVIGKGVPEILWKKALVSKEAHGELMRKVNEVLGNEMGFREIDWALDRDDWSKIRELIE